MLLYDIWIQAFCCQLFQMQSTVDERRNWEVCWIEFVSSTFWEDEVRWMISKFEHGSWSFGATATSLRTARSIWRMLDLFFHVSLEFRCRHIWSSHFKFNDLYEFNLRLIHIYIGIWNIVDYKFRAQLNFKPWRNSTISSCFFLLVSLAPATKRTKLFAQ